MVPSRVCAAAVLVCAGGRVEAFASRQFGVRVAAAALPLILAVCLGCGSRDESSPVEPLAPSGKAIIDLSHRRHPRPPLLPVPGGTLWTLTIDTPNQARCPGGGTRTLPMEIVLAGRQIELLYGFELWPTDHWTFDGTVIGSEFKATMHASILLRVEGRFSADGRHLHAKETDRACIRYWTAVRQ